MTDDVREAVERAKWVDWTDPKSAQAAESAVVVLLAHIEGEATRTAAAVAAATDRFRSAEQEWVDAVCHYRNLAIGLGAKPETMLNDFDRKLAQDGVSLTERTPGYWSMADSIEELGVDWRQVDALTAERDALRAQVERMRKAVLDALEGLGDRHTPSESTTTTVT